MLQFTILLYVRLGQCATVVLLTLSDRAVHLGSEDPRNTIPGCRFKVNWPVSQINMIRRQEPDAALPTPPAMS